MRVEEPMLSTVATRRRAESRSGAIRPMACQAPLNSSIDAISDRSAGVISSDAVLIPIPIFASNSTQSESHTAIHFSIHLYPNHVVGHLGATRRGARNRAWKGLTPEAEAVVLQDYFDDGSGKAPRYYQVNAINASIEAIAKGADRILLVMATGTGKTYTAFQNIWRLWKAGRKKRILFLADRNVLADQTMVNDFRPFGAAMAKLSTKAKTIERADGSAGELTGALDGRRVDGYAKAPKSGEHKIWGLTS